MKKNIYSILAAGAVVLAMAACSKEQDTQEGNTGVITESLFAEKESEVTKVSLNGTTLQFGWTAKDNASFTILNGSTYSFVDSEPYGVTAPNKFTVSYTGTRQGYAVTPANFKGSYNGTTLVVNYPESYDISADVAAGCYDNADGAHFIPFPMVAVSTSGSDAVTFRSIGALAKVAVANVPAGTKKLFVTFNKKVTGNFTVTNPASTSPFVTATDGTSTIEVKISEAGLTAKKNITLYIPVPTTTGLSISASTVTKSTVARNLGYVWSVEAISRVDTSTDFVVDGIFYQFAPSNLYVQNNGGTIQYHLRTNPRDQIITTLGANNQDPHRNGENILPLTPGNYRDLFTWDELYTHFTGKTAPSSACAIPWDKENAINAVETGNTNWHILNGSHAWYFIGQSGNYRDKANTIEVAGLKGALCAAVEIDLKNSPYLPYATYKSSEPLDTPDMVYGRFLFPDGYVDMTDLVSSRASTQATSNALCTIPYSAYEPMVDAGVVFLINTGGVTSGNTEIWLADKTNLAYWLNTAQNADEAYWLAGGAGYISSVHRDGARSKHLVAFRPVTTPSSND